MQGKSGIWIDHKEAFIVFAGSRPPHRIDAANGKHVRYTGEASGHGADDARERQFATHLTQYFDEVISHIHDAESIFIFGPGEAKGELAKRIDSKGLGRRVVGVEPAEQMTEPQIAAKVKEHYDLEIHR